MPMHTDLPFASLIRDAQVHRHPLRDAIAAAHRRSESEAVQLLLVQVRRSDTSRITASALARRLIEKVRAERIHSSGVDALMHEFSLSSDEGVALMCMAESLLRIPDRATADRLIADKIGKGDWQRHLGESPSLFINAATWGLAITGKLVSTRNEHGLGAALTRLIAKGGEPLIRRGTDLAMKMLGSRFVAGRTIEEALARGRSQEGRGYRHSYDMLGEAALTTEDAARYYAAYEHAIHAIGRVAQGESFVERPGISIKLSALHPRYSRLQHARVMSELLPRLRSLAVLCMQYGIGLNIDAEEADRLELSLDLMEALAFDPALKGFDGIGFVAQAYQKRCPFMIDWLIDLARRSGHRFMLRLVKGAYWDTEIKRAQVDGMPDYPVYTRKDHTDASYLVCAQKMLEAMDAIFPQFATHNAHTLATVHAWAEERGIVDYEFQCLHGMGETLYDQIVEPEGLNRPCRIYAPVGSHETLLPYLVRRLLENGANSSFVNRIVDEKISIDELLADPFEKASASRGLPHPKIILPADLFAAGRRNSMGIDWTDENMLSRISTEIIKFTTKRWSAGPLLHDGIRSGVSKPIVNPANREDIVGEVVEARLADIEDAVAAAQKEFLHWGNLSGAERASILIRASELFEAHRPELIALCVREAGKTLINASNEVREAVDFLRYYAGEAKPNLDGAGLGIIASISPWNFPLSIFTGQISAALAAGNCVLAKPAEQTPLVAFRAIELMYEAGVPQAALQFLPGNGEGVGTALVTNSRIKGVLFTGSTNVAHLINRSLSSRPFLEAGLPVLIAETGGQNAMIVDSSALLEQVVQDVLVSAFDSAGQRCSALRILYLQNEIADRVLQMLQGALAEWRVGRPDRLDTDIGPVIDEEAHVALMSYIGKLQTEARGFFQLSLPADTNDGNFVPPTIAEITSRQIPIQEVFGPVLHVVRYERNELPRVVEEINATRYGLTLGIHSRIDETISFISSHAHVGNIYVNRSMIGAAVGMQPFGGEGLSGTGPKAGGPFYLPRLRKNTEVVLQKHSEGDVLDSKLEEFINSMESLGYDRIAELAKQYRQTSSAEICISLPSPAGEQNCLRFSPKGTVFCVAVTIEGLLNQIMAVIATGNTVCVTNSFRESVISFFSEEFAARIEWVDSACMRNLSVDCILVEAGITAEIFSESVQWNGPIVPVIETFADFPIPVWRLFNERVISINVSAIGGNTALTALDF